jgi:hypothetical protein
MRAIELKYDKSVDSVIRELGDPYRKVLPRWYKNYLKEQENGIVQHARRSKYSMEPSVSGSLMLLKKECAKIPKRIQMEMFDMLYVFMVIKEIWQFLPRQRLT